jgi:hypothetical protein
MTTDFVVYQQCEKLSRESGCQNFAKGCRYRGYLKLAEAGCGALLDRASSPNSDPGLTVSILNRHCDNGSVGHGHLQVILRATVVLPKV